MWDGHSLRPGSELALSRVPHFSRLLREVGILIAWDGHSCPSPSTLIVKWTVWSGHSCPLLLTSILIGRAESPARSSRGIYGLHL